MLKIYRAWTKGAMGQSSAHKRCLTRSFGLVVPNGVVIWHADDRGTPHCIAVRPCDTHDDILNGKQAWVISKVRAEKAFWMPMTPVRWLPTRRW